MGLLPDKLNNYNVYDGPKKLVGISSEIKMFEMKAMSDTVNGAGIAGEFESPVEGAFGSQTIDITFSNISGDFFEFAASNEPTIIRGSMEVIDTTTQAKDTTPVVVTIKGPKKDIDTGTLKKGGKGEPKVTQEVTYAKISIGGKNVLELDKINMIYKLNGVDKLAKIRSQI